MKPNDIPDMDDPMGRHWDQPSKDEILFSDSTEVDRPEGERGLAFMTEATFEKLNEYSCSMPSGVYPGKMWSRHDGSYDANCPKEKQAWLLCWFGAETPDNKCPMHHREICIVEELPDLTQLADPEPEPSRELLIVDIRNEHNLRGRFRDYDDMVERAGKITVFGIPLKELTTEQLLVVAQFMADSHQLELENLRRQAAFQREITNRRMEGGF